MAEFIGKKLKVEIVGESHSEKIGVRVQGFPRVQVDGEALTAFTDRRKARPSVFSTTRTEPDLPEFVGMADGTLDGNFEEAKEIENA